MISQNVETKKISKNELKKFKKEMNSEITKEFYGKYPYLKNFYYLIGIGIFFIVIGIILFYLLIFQILIISIIYIILISYIGLLISIIAFIYIGIKKKSKDNC